MSSIPAQDEDPLALYARRIIQSGPLEPVNAIPQPTLPEPSANTSVSDQVETDPPVGIIGAGCAGLYAGLIFDSLGIKYEILEASNRVGGRVQTYHFPQKPGHPKGTHDYYDLGPMRFPETRIMKRLFKLFKYKKLNENGLSVEKKLIRYWFDTRDNNGIQYYNGIRKRLNVPADTVDPFDVEPLGVGEVYVKIGYKALFEDVIDRFAQGLKNDVSTGSDAGWKLMLQYDSYSTRSYMCHAYVPSPKLVAAGLPEGKHLPTDVVNWMETFTMTSGWYDRALTTTVLEELSFGYPQDPKNPVKFWCLEGGSEGLTNSMAEYLEREHPGSILRQHRVTAVSIKNPEIAGKSPLQVAHTTVTGEEKVKSYSHVIATCPTTVLRHAIDLTRAGLSTAQTNALRACNYTPATKVGMKFKSAWWTAGKDAHGNPIVDREGNKINIVGGRSFTDRPIRVVVYPSYGLDQDGPAVLICSFVWTEDAARIGALIGSPDPAVEKQLKEMVLRDLSDLHNIELEVLQDQYLDIFSVDWADNPDTMGSFALFGPGKFDQMYRSLTLPAGNGRLHFAGEAVSIRHGWIVGALDSTWRAINEYLLVAHPEKIQLFVDTWGRNMEWLKKPKKGAVDIKNSLLLAHINTFTPEAFEVNDVVAANDEGEGDSEGEDEAMTVDVK
ncbi:hypothetical protein PLICRDRAFT_52708 [Plicaturopsis crispa FD-325 SS-3]|nr:hypothetical protein PLICRDRAFT_52708 [Plicaturopsis crispa FD-325 SS-3]